MLYVQEPNKLGRASATSIEGEAKDHTVHKRTKVSRKFILENMLQHDFIELTKSLLKFWFMVHECEVK